MEAVTRRAKRGFNLIEAAIVLAVVGGVIGAIWVAATAVLDSFKISETASGILSACMNIYSDFPKVGAPKTGCDNCNVDLQNAAIGLNVFPASWLQNGVVVSPLGPVSTIVQWDLDVGSGKWWGPRAAGNVSFDIAIDSKSQCMNLVSTVASRISKMSSPPLSSLAVKIFSDAAHTHEINGTDYKYYIDLIKDVTPDNIQCGTYNFVEPVCITK